jgi:hypothetical protein
VGNLCPVAIHLGLYVLQGGLVADWLEEMAVTPLAVQIGLDGSATPGDMGVGDDPIHRLFERKHPRLDG